MKEKLLFFMALLFTFLLQQTPAQVFPETPLAVKTSARIAGMGGAFVAVADDEMALFYNPAGLKKLKHSRWTFFNPTFDIGSGAKTIQDLADDLDAATTNNAKADVLAKFVPTNVLAGINLFPFYAGKSFAFGLLGGGYLRTEVLNPVDTKVEISGYVDIALAGAYARQLTDKLSVGVTAKWINRQFVAPVTNKVSGNCTDPITTTDPIDPSRLVVVIEKTDVFNCTNIDVSDFSETRTTNGFGVDIGALYQFSPRLHFAFVARDIGDTSLSGGGINTSIPMTFTIGTAYYLPSLGPFHDPVIAFDVDRLGDPDSSNGRRLHLGAQATVLRKLSVRAGFNQGYPTFGLGFRLGILQFDYAFFQRERGKIAGDEVDTSQVISLSLRF